jgi:hypothetical protein
MSSDSSVRDALEGYIGGRLSAEQLVGVVAGAYYVQRDRATRDQLRPLMEIIERAHPGFVALFGSVDAPGFAVRLAERPFPKRFEAAFRQGVQALLAGGLADASVPASRAPVPPPGLFSRILQAIRKVFSA